MHDVERREWLAYGVDTLAFPEAHVLKDSASCRSAGRYFNLQNPADIVQVCPKAGLQLPASLRTRKLRMAHDGRPLRHVIRSLHTAGRVVIGSVLVWAGFSGEVRAGQESEHD